MNSPAHRRVKSRLITVWLVALSFIVPVLAGASSARADDNALTNDARLEAFTNPNGSNIKSGFNKEAGTGWYFILMVGLGVLGAGVMFKDAKRSYAK